MSSEMSSGKVVECLQCKKKFNLKKNKNAIQCNGDCKKWVHDICTGLESEELEDYLEGADKKWMCTTCNNKKKKDLQLIRVVLARQI